MNTTHTMRLIAPAGLCLVLVAPAVAQEANQFYLGLSAGPSRATIDEERITANLLGSGLTVTRFTRDERDTAFRLFGGYQFSRYFGVEAGYFNLGKYGFSATTTPPGTLKGEIKLQGINLDLVGKLPFTDRFSAIGRVGAQMASARDRFSGTGAVGVLDANPDKRETNYKFGGGLQYAFSPGFVLRGEVERYRINDAVGHHGDVDAVLVSLVFPFGGEPAAPPRAAEAPVAVPPSPPPPPPPPPPVVVAPPPPAPVAPERRRVSFSAESLFAFDKAAIKPEGRAALDGFVAQTRGTLYAVITVEGHTDRLGTTAYNQKLSLQRADAVKAYLVSTGALDAGKVSAVGKGESQPVTQANTCPGQTPNAKLIACLQPDRRVEIEVTGTR